MNNNPLLKSVHPEWRDLLNEAMKTIPNDYLNQLMTHQDWLPGLDRLFAAFSMPLSKVRTILFGESPYPRPQSANGYAFWDAQVGSLWSEKGLSKQVNRATSLRNFLKMLLFARGDLTSDFSQSAIAAVDKMHFHQTGEQLFQGLLSQGFLLLNASLVYREKEVPYHARMWRNFMTTLLDLLHEYQNKMRLILFGKFAQQMPGVERFPCLIAEHPYNISFVTNPAVVRFFQPLDLLVKS